MKDSDKINNIAKDKQLNNKLFYLFIFLEYSMWYIFLRWTETCQLFARYVKNIYFKKSKNNSLSFGNKILMHVKINNTAKNKHNELFNLFIFSKYSIWYIFLRWTETCQLCARYVKNIYLKKSKNNSLSFGKKILMHVKINNTAKNKHNELFNLFFFSKYFIWFFFLRWTKTC